MTDENVVHAKWDSAWGEKDYVVTWKANSVLLGSCSMLAVHRICWGPGLQKSAGGHTGQRYILVTMKASYM